MLRRGSWSELRGTGVGGGGGAGEVAALLATVGSIEAPRALGLLGHSHALPASLRAALHWRL